MLTRTYRAMSQRCVDAIIEKADAMAIETSTITVKNTGSVNEGPYLVTVEIDGFADNHRPARNLRMFADGLQAGYEIYRRDLEVGV